MSFRATRYDLFYMQKLFATVQTDREIGKTTKVRPSWPTIRVKYEDFELQQANAHATKQTASRALHADQLLVRKDYRR